MSLQLRHRLPLLLLAFLFAASSHGSPSGGNDSYDPSMCLQPRLCGNISIEYPFYLYNETAALRGDDDSYCGYPGLRIQCKDDTQAVLQLIGGNYTVSNINYTDSTVFLVDEEVLQHQSCPIVDHNLTFPKGSWLSKNVYMVDYLLFFLNCSFNPMWARPVGINPISCNSLNGQTYVWPGSKKLPPEELDQACQRVQVPVLELPDPDAPWNNSQWINGGYGYFLRSGFRLGWDQGKHTECTQCEHSDGKCGYNQAGHFMGCLCSDGRVALGCDSSGKLFRI